MSNNVSSGNKFGFNPSDKSKQTKQSPLTQIPAESKIIGQIGISISAEGKCYSSINFVAGYENNIGEVLVAMSNGSLVFSLLNRLSAQNAKQAEQLRLVIQALVKDKKEGPLIKPSNFSKQWRS